MAADLGVRATVPVMLRMAFQTVCGPVARYETSSKFYFTPSVLAHAASPKRLIGLAAGEIRVRMRVVL